MPEEEETDKTERRMNGIDECPMNKKKSKRLEACCSSFSCPAIFLLFLTLYQGGQFRNYKMKSR